MSDCPNCGAATQANERRCVWCGSGLDPQIREPVPAEQLRPAALARTEPVVVQNFYYRRQKKRAKKPKNDERQADQPGCLTRIGCLIVGLVSGSFGIGAFQNGHPWIGSFLLFVALSGLMAAFGTER
jgi:hypothetical protein